MPAWWGKNSTGVNLALERPVAQLDSKRWKRLFALGDAGLLRSDAPVRLSTGERAWPSEPTADVVEGDRLFSLAGRILGKAVQVKGSVFSASVSPDKAAMTDSRWKTSHLVVAG